MNDINPVLVSVRMKSGDIGEVILAECSVCYAIVREERLSDHMVSHS